MTTIAWMWPSAQSLLCKSDLLPIIPKASCAKKRNRQIDSVYSNNKRN